MQNVRQNDKQFVDFLIKFELITLKMIQKTISRKDLYICRFDENYPKDALHMFKENEPAIVKNETVLHGLPGVLYIIEVNGKIPEHCQYSLAMTQAAHNQKQTNTGGLVKLLEFGAKVMLRVNISIKDCLINSQTGNVRHIQFAQGNVSQVHFKFSDEEAGLKAAKLSYFGRNISWVPIENFAGMRVEN